MALYEHDRDMLAGIIYYLLQDLWSAFTDAIKVFDAHGSVQPMCAQKVWQTVLLAREITRMMGWDGKPSPSVMFYVLRFVYFGVTWASLTQQIA
jgi:hypothetical protein